MSVSNGDSEANIAQRDVNTDYKSRFKYNFEIVQRLGKGGYGVVFEVKNIRDGRKYAIKRIELTSQSRDVIECETKFKYCRHPNIVEYFDSWIEQPPANWQENEDQVWMRRLNLLPIALPYYGTEMTAATDCTEETACTCPTTIPSEFFYIQMELCQKDNLAEWLLKSNSTVRKNQYITIFRQIVEAVKFMIEKNLIFRDLKPENIYFGFDDRIKIGDFGSCTEHENQVSSCRKHKRKNKNHPVLHTAGIGTDSYKAPELKGRNYDSKVDIFSLGVILYELITPFRTQSERYEAIDRLHNTPFPKDFDPNFKEEFELVKMMLSRNPKKRPTIHLVEKHLTNWGASDNSRNVSYIDFFSLFTSLMTRPMHATEMAPVYSNVKEKIISKNRPLKMKKDNHILQ